MYTLRIKKIIIIITCLPLYTIAQIDSALKYLPEIISGLTKEPVLKEIKKHTPLFKRKDCKDSSLYCVSRFTTYSETDSITDLKFLQNYKRWKAKEVRFLIILGNNTYVDYDNKLFISGTVYCLYRDKRYKEWWAIKRGIKHWPTVDFLYSTKDKTFKYSSPFH